MLTQYNLKMPHAVYGGENAMDNITAIIKARGAKKVAMFTDKALRALACSPCRKRLSRPPAQSIMCWTSCPRSPATWLCRSWWTSSRSPVQTSSWPAAAAL